MGALGPNGGGGGGGEEVDEFGRDGKEEVRLYPERIAGTWGDLRIKRKSMVWGRK